MSVIIFHGQLKTNSEASSEKSENIFSMGGSRQSQALLSYQKLNSPVLIQLMLYSSNNANHSLCLKTENDAT